MKKLCSLLLVFEFLFNFGVLAEKTSEKDAKSETKVTSKETDSKQSESSETVSKSEFPKPRAKSAVVIDANSGDTIYAQEAEKKLYPAG
ncbi:MAG: hypothetical protein IK072_00745, partial [Clostridia bacterium]|nr:hypothetical protein [Clostridia bacterium]